MLTRLERCCISVCLPYDAYNRITHTILYSCIKHRSLDIYLQNFTNATGIIISKEQTVRLDLEIIFYLTHCPLYSTLPNITQRYHILR